MGHRAGTQSPSHCRPCDTTKPVADETATLRYRRTERTALYIETQEGDVVRLNIKVRDAATATAGTTTDDGTQVAELALSSRSSVKISFHVEGDLNADELAAIRSVVEQAGVLAEEFFAGDLPAAFAAAQELDIDGAQLAKVGLRLSVREHLTYNGSAAAWPVPVEPAPAPSPEPAQTVEPAASVPPAAAAPVEVEPAPSTPPATPADAPIATTATEPAVPSAAPKLVAGQAFTAIAGFLQQLLDTLGTAAPTDDTAPSLSLSLQLRIFRATVLNLAVTQLPTTAAEQDTTAAMPLVADTLDALAATQEPPLDARA